MLSSDAIFYMLGMCASLNSQSNPQAITDFFIIILYCFFSHRAENCYHLLYSFEHQSLENDVNEDHGVRN